MSKPTETDDRAKSGNLAFKIKLPELSD